MDPNPSPTESRWAPDLADIAFAAIGGLVPPVLPLAALVYLLRRVPWARQKAGQVIERVVPPQAERQSPAIPPAPAQGQGAEPPSAPPSRTGTTPVDPPRSKPKPTAEQAGARPTAEDKMTRPMEMLISFHQFGGAASGVVPHLLIVGPAGIGKTTLLHAMAREWHQQHDEVIVLDLDAPRGGYPYRVIGGGGDGERVGAAFAALHRLLEKRETARFRGEQVAPPVRCLVNDAHEMARMDPATWNDLVGRILRRGHKLDVLLVLTTYASQVDTVVPPPQDDLMPMRRVELAWEGEQRVARLNGQTYAVPITS